MEIPAGIDNCKYKHHRVGDHPGVRKVKKKHLDFRNKGRGYQCLTCTLCNSTKIKKHNFKLLKKESNIHK